MRGMPLGDDIDDYCVRCKRIIEPLGGFRHERRTAKVRCRTAQRTRFPPRCWPPPPKGDPRKQALFDEVLKKVDPGAAAPLPWPARELPA